MTTTTTNVRDKVAVLFDHSRMEGGCDYFHFFVSSLESAEYNADFEIPNDYMIESESEVSGLKFTTYKSIFGDWTAVKTVNEDWGVSVSFYNAEKWVAEYLFEIEK